MTKRNKMKSKTRRIIWVSLLSFLVLLIFLILVPVLFRPRVVAFAKKQLNKQLTATVDFSDVRISLLRNFPRLDIKLVDLSIVGKDNFRGDTLLFSPATHIVTNIKTLFKSSVKVYAIELVDPLINAKIDSNGKENFDIARKSSSGGDSGDSAEYSLDLESYSIKNGAITYNDDASKIYTAMKHFDHSGKGNFTAVKFLVNSNTTADSVSFKYGTITYLNDAVIDVPLEVNIDTKAGQYDFHGEKLTVNSVPLYVKGRIAVVNDSTDKLDITVKTQQADFKSLLTLIPGIYTQNLNNLQTGGKAVIDGRISGLSTSSRIPDFNFKIDVTDGFIKNPDFNEPLQNINVNAAIVNTGGVNDATVITLRNGTARVGNEPVQFALGISRPVSAMLLDLSLKGKLQLEKIRKILKMEDMELRGLLHADLNASGPLSAFEGQDANAIRASGILSAENFYYKDKSTMPFYAGKVNMNFNNTQGDIIITDGNYNSTDFSAKGSIFNFFNFLFVNAPLRGKFTASSPEINLADWNSSGGGTVTTSSAATKPFIVPANLLLDIDAHTDKLLSDRIVINDLSGKILFAGKKMLFENLAGKAFGGNIMINGSYSSEITPLQPDITLNYKMNNLDVQETFKAVITAQSLMPIGNYLSGTMSSELSASGKLGDNFYPILNSLNGNGTLLLLNGVLQKFAPLEKIAERLDIDRLKNIATREIKNRFSFENGRVDVLPFKFTIFENYDFEVAGRHGFDNSMDYAVKLSLPRKELGQKGNQLLDGLLSKIGKTGLNLKPNEKVSFFIKLTGTLKSPLLDIQLDKTLSSEFDNLKKQAEEQIKTKIDSTKSVLKDTLKSIKKDILHGVKDKILNKQDTATQQKPVKDSSGKKQVIKSVIDIFSRKNKKDSL